MKTALARICAGRYRHERLGVEIEKTAMPATPWQLSGLDHDGSGVVHARTLADARAFLQDLELALPPVLAGHPEPRPAGERSAAEDALLAVHQYLFPERYEDVVMYAWHAGTTVEVAEMLQRALVGIPGAELSPKGDVLPS